MELWEKYNDKYDISNYGNIRNNITKKLYKPHKDKDGYLIHNNIKLHRAVALTFIPNPNNYTDVDHIDYNRSNNNVNNLRWCSHKDNCQHSSKNYGKHCKILNTEQVEEIREKYKMNKGSKKSKNKLYTIRSLANEYNCNHETIRKIILNLTYKKGGEDL